MISNRDFELEHVRAVVFLREKATACQCGKKPVHSYEPGCRVIRCETIGPGHTYFADDVPLVEGFRAWNRLRISEKKIAADAALALSLKRRW